ncbi:hypothetical protein GCM10010330_66440 [Streptomyces tendae]|nr:hypothetical protein GCM10010330_66440 [Streptomyces tendae]
MTATAPGTIQPKEHPVTQETVSHDDVRSEPLSRQDLTPIPEEQLILRLPKTFTDPAVERRHRKERLAGALRLFGRFGFEEGVAGHITARDPEYPDHFWVNPFGMSFKHVKVSDLLLVNHDGEVVQGRHRVNRAAFAIHSAVHAARPDVIGAAHSHSVYGKALSATTQRLEPLTQDACAFYEDHGCYENYSGVANDPEEGRRIAEALGGHKAVILRNHGLLTAAGSVDAAAWWFITMERSAQAQLAAKARFHRWEAPACDRCRPPDHTASRDRRSAAVTRARRRLRHGRDGRGPGRLHRDRVGLWRRLGLSSAPCAAPCLCADHAEGGEMPPGRPAGDRQRHQRPHPDGHRHSSHRDPRIQLVVLRSRQGFCPEHGGAGCRGWRVR